jgi:membrane peptidoglycan carboxypeptidase
MRSRGVGGRRRRHELLWYVILFVVAGLVGLVAATVVGEGPLLRSLPARVHRYVAEHGGLYLPLRDISPFLQEAIIATEDHTFYTNIGVSFEGIARSIVVDVMTGRFEEGGSTITQQLVRDQLLTPAKTIQRKLEEMILAVLLTREMSKRQILDLYLNEVYFGHGAYGAWAAARIYFGRRPIDLTRAQATLLAGLPQAPSYLDPFVHPRAAKARQWAVLESMVSVHDLTLRQARAIYRAPWGLRRAG